MDETMMICNWNKPKSRKYYLKFYRDTHEEMDFMTFTGILINKLKFKVGYQNYYKGENVNERTKNYFDESELIFYHSEKGLIVHAESYNGYIVKSATLYGELENNKNISLETAGKSFIGARFHDTNKGTFQFEVPFDYGFRIKLQYIPEYFRFLQSWSQVPSTLRFTNYMEEKDENCDLEEVHQQKLKACNVEVRKILGVS